MGWYQKEEGIEEEDSEMVREDAVIVWVRKYMLQ